MQPLKFGVALPYGPAKSSVRLAQQAEEAGWSGAFLGDAIWCEDPLIALAAAAVSTRRIRLGTMLVPAPLRRPWRLASAAVALDRLSDGRLILGLGAGAVWMGWQAFPDEVRAADQRGEILDETIDILTLLFSRTQADYHGKHFHLELTQLDPQYYPQTPVQQPRIPLWVPGLWPRRKSMSHVLKADGLFPEKVNSEGKGEEVTPADLQAMLAYVSAQRSLTTPFDAAASGQTAGMSRLEQQDKLCAWQAAGATWWVETLFSMNEEQAQERIRQGPPACPA